MNLDTHRSRTAERNSTGADTEGCATFDTTATSHGGDKEPCPGLQMSEWDSNRGWPWRSSSRTATKFYQGLRQTAALHFDTMSEWDSNRGWPWHSSSRTATKFYKGLEQTAVLRSIWHDVRMGLQPRPTFHEQLSISNWTVFLRGRWTLNQ